MLRYVNLYVFVSFHFGGIDSYTLLKKIGGSLYLIDFPCHV